MTLDGSLDGLLAHGDPSDGGLMLEALMMRDGVMIMMGFGGEVWIVVELGALVQDEFFLHAPSSFRRV